MTPELQNLLVQAQQNAAGAQRHAQFVGYSTYVAIIVCVIFAVLIFWKLCQIQKQLITNSHTQQWKPSAQAGLVNPEPTMPPTAQSRIQDDSRYMPKR
jgi:hypothetical protein